MTDSTPEKPTLKRCPVCRGRGAIRCDCWPGDCICGWDDEPCDNCDGTGFLDPRWDYDYLDDYPDERLPAAGSAKFGPDFPPSCCTAWEDCQHDGICHDPRGCGAIGPNQRRSDE